MSEQPIGHRPTDWSAIGVVLSFAVLAGSILMAYVELAKQQSASLVVDSGQDKAIEACFGAIKEARAASIDNEILQRLTAVETKLDDLRNEKRKR